MSTVAAHPEAVAAHRAFDAFERDVDEAVGLVNAATARLVEVVRRCIAERRWEEASTHGPEHWLAVRCGMSWAEARRLVRLAEGLERFPRVSELFAEGRLTEDQVSVIVARARPGHDRDLAHLAPHTNVGQLRRVIAALPPSDDDDDPPGSSEKKENESRARATDVLHAGWGDDGRFRGRFDLGVEVGTVVEQALRSARNCLFRESTGTDPEERDDVAEAAGSDGVSWAAALGRLAYAGLQGLDPASSSGQRPSDRHQVIVHVDAAHPERSRIHLGPLLGAADRRYLTCDADIRSVLCERGVPVALGRRQRVVDAVRRALIEDRDGGCRIDGCERRGWLHIHHLLHWEDGGPTDPSNLVALCTTHHRMVHTGQLRLLGDPTEHDGLLVLDEAGRPLPRPSPRPPEQLPAAPCRYVGPDRSERLRLDLL